MKDWYAKYAHNAVEIPTVQPHRRQSRVSIAPTSNSGRMPAEYRAKEEKCGAVTAANTLIAAQTVYETGSLRTQPHSSPIAATTRTIVNAPAPLPTWLSESSAEKNGLRAYVPRRPSSFWIEYGSVQLP